jgi:uncharacterized ParB-like nuclease family protein
MYYQPPHEVRDQEKLEAMIEILKNGGELPPVLVCGDRAYSGSHRLAAWESMGMEAVVVEMSDEEYCEVMTELGLDPMYDDATDLEDFLNVARELGFAGKAE